MGPLRAVVSLESFDNLLDRWNKKKLSQNELDIIEKVFARYSRLFEHDRVRTLLRETGTTYQFLLSQKPSDEATNTAPEDAHRANDWVHALEYVFAVHEPTIDLRTDTGKMIKRLYLSVFASIRAENKLEKDSTGDSSGGSQDISDMTLEEQVEKLDLKPETYFNC